MTWKREVRTAPLESRAAGTGDEGPRDSLEPGSGTRARADVAPVMDVRRSDGAGLGRTRSVWSMPQATSLDHDAVEDHARW